MWTATGSPRSRAIERRAADFGRHLRGGAKVVVHADLDEVGAHGGHAVHLRPRWFGRLRGDDRAGRAQPRAVERRGVLRVAEAESDVAAGAQAEHGGDALARVERQPAEHVLPAVELRSRAQSPGFAGVPVSVHDSGSDGLAGGLDPRGARGRAHAVHRPGIRDAPASNHHDAALDRRSARSADHPPADECRREALRRDGAA